MFHLFFDLIVCDTTMSSNHVSFPLPHATVMVLKSDASYLCVSQTTWEEGRGENHSFSDGFWVRITRKNTLDIFPIWPNQVCLRLKLSGTWAQEVHSNVVTSKYLQLYWSDLGQINCCKSLQDFLHTCNIPLPLVQDNPHFKRAFSWAYV